MDEKIIRLHISLSHKELAEINEQTIQEPLPTQDALDCIARDLMQRLTQSVMIAPELLRCYQAWKEHRDLEEEQHQAQGETRWLLPSIPLDDDVVAWDNVRKIINELLMLYAPKLARIWYALDISMIMEEGQST